MKRSVVDDIVQPLTTTLGNDKTRVSLALSIAIAYSIPLPNSYQSKPPAMYYIEHYMQIVNQVVSDFNERWLVDVVGIAEAVKVIWVVRYDMLFSRDPAKLTAIANGTCPIRDYLASFSLDNDTASRVIAAGIASIDRVERLFHTPTQTTDV